MLVDFTKFQGNTDRLPEIPLCRTSEVLVNDGRPCSDFRLLLSLAVENNSSSPALSANGSESSPVELLKQLL